MGTLSSRIRIIIQVNTNNKDINKIFGNDK